MWLRSAAGMAAQMAHRCASGGLARPGAAPMGSFIRFSALHRSIFSASRSHPALFLSSQGAIALAGQITYTSAPLLFALSLEI